MASVTSLDKDLKNLRLSKYTTQSANEAREWIRTILGDSAIGDGDLMEELKSGVVLCRLVNSLVPNAARYKESAMPFVQMENISLFLRILSAPPLSLPPHDLFLTVDLYESKDPAQVLQTIQSFSRVANAQNSNVFPTAIGPKKNSAGMASPSYGTTSRFISPNSTGNASKSKPAIPSRSTNVSSWSKNTDEYTTAPAWNIHQYGYMGGASQGPLNVVMGGRRQITTAAPTVPTLQQKEERRKKEQLEAEEAQIVEQEMARRRAEEEEERRLQAEEEARWERQAEEDRKKYKIQEENAERARLQKEAQEQSEKRRETQRLATLQAESERRVAQEAEEKRKLDEAEAKEAQRRRQTDRIEYSYEGLNSDSGSKTSNANHFRNDSSDISSEQQRILHLEKELAAAKERERQYQQEMEQRRQELEHPPASRSNPSLNDENEREYLKDAWTQNRDPASRPLPTVPSSNRPVPTPVKSSSNLPYATRAAQRNRELLDQDDAENEEAKHITPEPSPIRAPLSAPRWSARSRPGSVLNKPGNGSGSGMSLVQREMELERQRQKEWEMNQQQLQEDRGKMTEQELADNAPAWDVNQYGYTGGANQGKEQVSFGAKRQIIGPR